MNVQNLQKQIINSVDLVFGNHSACKKLKVTCDQKRAKKIGSQYSNPLESIHLYDER